MQRCLGRNFSKDQRLLESFREIMKSFSSYTLLCENLFQGFVVFNANLKYFNHFSSFGRCANLYLNFSQCIYTPTALSDMRKKILTNMTNV